MHFSLLILSALLSLAIATPFPQNLLFEDEPSVEDPAPFNLPSSPDLFAYADTSSSSSIQQSPQIFNLEDGGSFYLARENPSCRGAGTYCCAASSHIQDESRTDCRAFDDTCPNHRATCCASVDAKKQGTGCFYPTNYLTPVE